MEQAEKAGIPRMKELVGILKRADTAYYKHDDPIMTDREYDALFDELKMLEDNSGIVPVSYTHLTLPTNREV